MKKVTITGHGFTLSNSLTCQILISRFIHFTETEIILGPWGSLSECSPGWALNLVVLEGPTPLKILS